MKEEISTLKTLIAENKIEKAFSLFKELIINNGANESAFLALSAKWKNARKQELMNLIDPNQSSIIFSGLTNELIRLANEIENSDQFSDLLITPSAQSLSARSKVFISYNHSDSKVAQVLREKLENANISVTIDSQNMKAGADIKEFIDSSVRDTDITLSVVSKKSLLSAWVAMESINTFHHQRATNKKFIACYLEDDFFDRHFTDEALDNIEGQVKDIRTLITRRLEKNRSIRDLQNELSRFTDLMNNMDEIIRRLRETLCIDITHENLDKNFARIIQAIHS